MRAQNDAGQRLSALQRVLALLCILVLFVSVGILFFLAPKVYAYDGTHHLVGDVAMRRKRTPVVPTPTNTLAMPTPTNTPVLPTPTDTPIPTPTNTPIVPTPTATPIPMPTNTPIPTPTNTPMPTATTAPTSTPTVPRATPTIVVKPTSTSVAGVPPGGTLPQTTPTPTPTQLIATATSTPSNAGVLSGPTSVVSSPTTTTNTTYGSAAITPQDNGKMLLPTAPEIAIGTSVVGAVALMGWYVWRRRQGGLLAAAYTPQSASVSYAQTPQAGGTIGVVRETGLGYAQGTANQGRGLETLSAPQTLIQNADTSLETIMRQAQRGLFALPNKEEYS